MIRLGILSFSDTRKSVHESLSPYIKECENKIKDSLDNTGEFEVIAGSEIICDAKIAKEQANRMNSLNVDGIILNIAIFGFPNLSLIAATVAKGPFIAVTLANPKLPGLVGLMANAGLLHQNNIKCQKVWGDIEKPEILRKLVSFGRAAHAVSTLKGQVYGLIGGRSIGIGTGAANPDLWIKTFGVDVEHADQSEILRRAPLVDEAKVNHAFEWLTKHAGKILYDGDKLTEDTLKMQIRYYYATKEIIKDNKMDFVGVKCHYEMSAYSGPQCLAASFMNDPYDWDGPKEPFVYSCESDSDGAMTMHIMKLVSGKPSFLIDVRYFDEQEGVFIFCNCGAMATWYAKRSDSPEENLKEVNIHPIIPKYAGKGCHIQHIAAEGEITFGRLSHCGDRYKLIMFKGEAKKFPEEKLAETSPSWPHVFAKVYADPYRIIERYESNHVHGIPGDYIEELKNVCELLNIECEVIE